MPQLIRRPLADLAEAIIDRNAGSQAMQACRRRSSDQVVMGIEMNRVDVPKVTRRLIAA
jgi:hypothetical protein